MSEVRKGELQGKGCMYDDATRTRLSLSRADQVAAAEYEGGTTSEQRITTVMRYETSIATDVIK